jgi:hypothetical protein
MPSSNLLDNPSPNGRNLVVEMKKKTYIKVPAGSLKRGNSIKLPDNRIVVLTQDAKPGTFAGMVILKWGESPQQYCHRSQNESVEKLG